MQNYTTKRIIIKIGICLAIILILFLLLYIFKNKKIRNENEIIKNTTTIEYEAVNDIDNDEYQRRVYEQSIKQGKLSKIFQN